MATTLADLDAKVRTEVGKAVLGKSEVVQSVLAAILTRSHVMFEDVPGVAKTHLVKSVAKVLGLDFRRIQCTPDLLPSDMTGVSVFNPKTTGFEFRPGPVFANLVLVDELNRATPRTQSALLECMAEGQVTVDGETRPLPPPFSVFATQNPIEFEGTFPLPEAQLDRFAMRLAVGYPTEEDEPKVLRLGDHGSPSASLSQVAEKEELLKAALDVEQVIVKPAVEAYIVKLVRATRAHVDALVGASPRASIDLFRLSRAFAGLNGQAHVDPEAVRWIAARVLQHRLVIKPESRLRGRTPATVVADVCDSVPLPSAQ